jgi:hypothetical protein
MDIMKYKKKGVRNMNKSTYQSYTSLIGILAAVTALAYAYFFVVAKDVLIYSFSLTLLGLFTLKLFVVLYGRLKEVHEGIARIAVTLASVGAVGMLAHGGYDLANAINPPTGINASLPSQIDPRGLLAFGLSGLGILKISYLMSKDKYFSKNLSLLGYVSGALLVVIYLARLTVLDPTNPLLLYPVLLNGFIAGPLWYLWIGLSLRKG